MYRKSPGRQYGYDYDPLRDHSDQSQGESTQDERPHRASTQLVQRPDPRRTRQLTRKSIIASKGRAASESSESEEPEEQYIDEKAYERPTRRTADEDQDDPTFYSHRRHARSDNLAQPRLPSTRQLMERGEEDEFAEGTWQDAQEVDPDQGYEDPDPLDVRLGYAQTPSARSGRLAPRDEQAAPLRARQFVEPDEYEDEYEDEDEDEYEDEEIDRPRRRTKKVSRRGLLVGLGAVALGGAGVAAYELGPKIPGVVNGAATNIERQLEDAFNKGLTQGAENARKELLTALQNLEGFTLDGAIGAARLTRVAYDVFVSPIVKVGSILAGDFLTTMLRAVITARNWLKGAYLDNGTLEAIQTVLQSWVDQVKSLPQQLDAITSTDLDGAQSYLQALEAKIKDEQKKLNQSGTPTPAPTQKSK
ncbi:MAG: hypothetical protein NVSMB38_12280 [Ktedonobacteraceae bacterium]